MSAEGWLADTRTSYDTVATSYADQVRNLLDETPYERMVLALFADLVRATEAGPVADVGCGPGRITAYLHELGVDTFGIDLSPAGGVVVLGVKGVCGDHRASQVDAVQERGEGRDLVEEASDGLVQGVAVRGVQHEADGGGMGRADQAGQQVGAESEQGQDALRGVGDPLADSPIAVLAMERADDDRALRPHPARLPARLRATACGCRWRRSWRPGRRRAA
ncbi:hypothetical protein [Streptomyces sp. NPDC056821]|uniref:hypothetical protein n=1 Tax=unclassified Streptomyces TaxID=2593676 RepID=UPI0036B13A56